MIMGGLTINTWASDTKPVEDSLLIFGAKWCTFCHKLEKVLQEEDVQIVVKKGFIKYYTVDIDKNPQSAKDYKVGPVPTMIIIRKEPDGVKIIDRQVGFLGRSKLIEWLEKKRE
jgi:thioredoxin-like negative regulator of GroEL